MQLIQSVQVVRTPMPEVICHRVCMLGVGAAELSAVLRRLTHQLLGRPCAAGL